MYKHIEIIDTGSICVLFFKFKKVESVNFSEGFYLENNIIHDPITNECSIQRKDSRKILEKLDKLLDENSESLSEKSSVEINVYYAIDQIVKYSSKNDALKEIHNIIKYCKPIAVKLNREIYEDGKK